MEIDDEKEDLKVYLDIVPREDVAKDVESLSTKGDGSSKNYKVLSEMLEDFDRQDVEELYRLVKESTNGVSTASTYLVLPELVNTARRKINTADGDPRLRFNRGLCLRDRDTSYRKNIVIASRIDQGVGSTSGIRACALRNFDLEVMELENTQNNALAKLPMLKLGEYEMWEIRIKQYFQIQDYALWEVIENGNSWVPIPVTAPETGPSTATKMTVPSTAEEKTCKKNDVKARSLLLMALPNEHQLTFDQYVDAQSMFAAIKARFGGNEATKKTQKALLKQQYENFNASSSESLDSIFNRLQKLWFPSAERVKISSTNIRLETTMPQKEETFQVIIDVIKNSTCFKAFTIYEDVLEIFMQQFWYTIKKVQDTDSYELLLANKKCIVNAEVFRTILDICPRIEGVDFAYVPDDDTALTFLIDLGYKGPLNRLLVPTLDRSLLPVKDGE
ncbi:hypothetical protein Tco_0163782 [Tanacetum coccineum]